MGKTSWTRDLGAVSASSAAGLRLSDRPDLPTHAVIKTAILRNGSQAVLTVINAPGQPQVDAGERVDVDMDGAREVHVQNDAVAIALGDVKVTLVVEWEDA
jgi:hypothetical protein